MINQPSYLKEGDKVALVSPAYWMPEDTLIQTAEVIRRWGLQPAIGPHTNSLNVNVYAGTADERASDLLWALNDDNIKAIVCSRGGYGSIHLLNRIPAEVYQRHPKWLIGHGDVTMLLNAAVGAGTMCIHGPLIGGNLSSYAAIAGTKFHLSQDQDIILFIEEVEEALHDIDRLFYTLRLILDFERVKGIIFGTFSSIKFDLQFGSVEQMLIAHLHDLDIPVCCGFPVGSNSCLPLIEGAPCSLDVTLDKSVLTFNIEGSVETYEIGREQPQLMKPEPAAICID